MLRHQGVQGTRAAVNSFGIFQRARGFVLPRLLS